MKIALRAGKPHNAIPKSSRMDGPKENWQFPFSPSVREMQSKKRVFSKRDYFFCPTAALDPKKDTSNDGNTDHPDARPKGNRTGV